MNKSNYQLPLQTVFKGDSPWANFIAQHGNHISGRIFCTDLAIYCRPTSLSRFSVQSLLSGDLSSIVESPGIQPTQI